MSMFIFLVFIFEVFFEKFGGCYIGFIIVVIIIVFVIIVSIIFVVIKNMGQDFVVDGKMIVKIGMIEVVNDYWNVIKKKVVVESINIEVVSFNDYIQFNVVLFQGQIDFNVFQYLFFLVDYDVKNNDNIIVLVVIYIVLLNIYLKKYQWFFQLFVGVIIVILNDVINQGCVLLVLQEVGLLKLWGNGLVLFIFVDVIINQFKVKVKVIDVV